MKAGWQTKTLEEEIDLLAGFAFKSAQYTNADEAIRLLRGDNIVQGCLRWDDVKKWPADDAAAYDNYQLRDGDVVLAMDRPWVKAGLKHAMIAAEDLPCLLVQRTARLRPGANLDNRFLMYLIGSDAFTRHTLGVQTGIGVPHISGQQIKDFQFIRPPLAEQRRIVGILDEAFEGLATAKANAEQNLQNARALFESVLDVTIRGKLISQNSNAGEATVLDLMKRIDSLRNAATEQGRAKPLKTVSNEFDHLDQLPVNWQWTHLERLTVGISDGVHKKPEYTTEGIPFIKVNNLTAGSGISFDDVDFISRSDHEEFIKRTHPEKGDILISKDGTIGVVRLIETDVEFSIFVSVALVKPVMREMARYLVYALRASSVQSQIVPQGAALKHLYLVDLRRLSIPLPPLSEQNRIVERLDALREETQRLESLYQRKLAALDELKKSLLHRAFSGQL